MSNDADNEKRILQLRFLRFHESYKCAVFEIAQQSHRGEQFAPDEKHPSMFRANTIPLDVRSESSPAFALGRTLDAYRGILQVCGSVTEMDGAAFRVPIGRIAHVLKTVRAYNKKYGNAEPALIEPMPFPYPDLLEEWRIEHRPEGDRNWFVADMRQSKLVGPMSDKEARMHVESLQEEAELYLFRGDSLNGDSLNGDSLNGYSLNLAIHCAREKAVHNCAPDDQKVGDVNDGQQALQGARRAADVQVKENS